MTFSPGAKVRVRRDWPETRGPSHVRTPHYLRGQPGIVMRALGEFPNPEELAFGRPASREKLYHVRFDQTAPWHEGVRGDELWVELFEFWLEPA